MDKMTIVLPDERPISWNKFYSGKHWSVRAKEKDRVLGVVRSALDMNHKTFDKLVSVEVICYFKNRPQDSSNICAKLYEDALGHPSR